MSRQTEPERESGNPSRREEGYVESQVIMMTVKVVTPFVLTYGLFITFHGADAPGGGFQGGAVIGSVVLIIAFAFGIDPTREWLSNTTIVALVGGGVTAFATIGLIPMALGGSFLEYRLLPIHKPVRYGIEGVEILGIAAIVSGALIGLFFVTAAGYAVGTTATGPGSGTAAESDDSGAEHVITGDGGEDR